MSSCPYCYVSDGGRPSNPSDSQSTHDAKPIATDSSQNIATQLEDMIRKHVAAVNERDFSNESDVWRGKSSSWSCHIGFLSNEKLDLPQYVERWRGLVETYPEFGCTVSNMFTTVHQEHGYAVNYVDIETVGMPSGLVRRQVGITTFQLVNGTWMATCQRTMPGI